MVDLDRRTLLATSSAAVAAAATVGAANAKDDDGPSLDVKIDWKNLTDEQKKLLGVRFPTLDAESQLDFVTGARRVFGAIPGTRQATGETERFLKTKGMSTLDDTDLSPEQAWNLMTQDAPYAARLRVLCSLQMMMWDRASRALHVDREKLLAAMEETDHAGPGKLELHPEIETPDYTRNEIHQQPGGYVGDPLGGWVYHYGVTLGYRAGTSYHDENHIEYTQAHVKPADGRVRRILDIGCGTGQSTTAMKMRFPNAEVWGIDIGAPMVRYAHYRAVKMGVDVNFRHGLAEDTKFPDGYFDMVTDHLVFHEVTANAAQKISAEILRVLRPGGVFSHHDLLSEGNPNAAPSHTVQGKAGAWEAQRHNNYESWFLEYTGTDFPGVLKQKGFTVAFPEKPSNGMLIVAATKPV